MNGYREDKIISKNMDVNIQRIQKDDQKKISELVQDYWEGDPVVAHGKAFHTNTLEGLKALNGNDILGFLHYQIRDVECEILTLASLQKNQGIGSALIAALENIARESNSHTLSLITTNDNLHALGFYQRRGFHLTTLSPGQVDVSRQLKPSIPEIGDNNIPLRDEIRLEKSLV
jgi:ribosomal protein S18 acetylase RimI-like enzyme